MKNISQKYGVHVLERDIVIEVDIEYQNYLLNNINELTKANNYKIVKGK